MTSGAQTLLLPHLRDKAGDGREKVGETGELLPRAQKTILGSDEDDLRLVCLRVEISEPQGEDWRVKRQVGEGEEGTAHEDKGAG